MSNEEPIVGASIKLLNLPEQSENHPTMEKIGDAIFSDAARTQLQQLLSEHNIDGLVLAPEHDAVVRGDTGSEVLAYTYSKKKPLGLVARAEVADDIGEILGMQTRVENFSPENYPDLATLKDTQHRGIEQNPFEQMLKTLNPPTPSTETVKQHGG